jgi:hypothetical protein
MEQIENDAGCLLRPEAVRILCCTIPQHALLGADLEQELDAHSRMSGAHGLKGGTNLPLIDATGRVLMAGAAAAERFEGRIAGTD